MAKINVSFNNKNYSIDESDFADASAKLQYHLSNTMNGTGASVNLGGLSYNIDATKLSTATSDFVSHLSTLSGNGSKVIVNGVTYTVDSAKVAGAVSTLEATLEGLNNPAEPEGEKKFKTIVYLPDMGVVDYCELVAAQGLICVNVAVLPTKTTDGIMLSGHDGEYLYYIEDENDICIYSGSKDAYGCEGWLSRALHLGMPFNGAISDISQATEVGLYALIYTATPSEDETLEGDGQEFHKFAPTALTFRSTAPLNEFQEVQINGVTVDPSNYTTEEGSTVITLPIEYLKTLDVDNYEITVVSDSKSARGGFTVVQPELNEHGFYYNQPYVGYVAYYGQKWVFFFRENGTMDFIILEDIDGLEGYKEVCPYAFENSIITVNGLQGTFTGSITADGIYCNELSTLFMLGNQSIVADEDYLYLYKEYLNGYEVNVINNTKDSYGAIKTDINGIDTVKMARAMFAWSNAEGELITNTSLVIPPKIPNSITVIGESAFAKCKYIATINFEGTTAQWNAITKGDFWNYQVPATYVQCSDGQVSLV